jgi:undecaprenyl-diphosphatase
MIERLEQLDQQLFLFLNSLHGAFFDPVMYALSGKLIWAPLYAAILTYIALRDKRMFFFFLIFILLSVFLADRGSVLIKHLVGRLRPCHEPELEGLVYIVREKCGGLYSFVSSHASNSFNVAFISLLAIRKRWFTVAIILWALIVGYTRIYLGVHYPADVLFGSVYGALTGWFCYSLFRYFEERYLSKKFTTKDSKVYTKDTKEILP